MSLKEVLSALDKSFSFKKLNLFVTNIILLFCLLIYLFFQNLVVENLWMKMVLFYLPLFLVNTLLYSLGVFLHVSKEKDDNGKRIWIKTSKKLSKSLHLPLVPIVLFLGVWIVLGVFYLLQAIPVLGFFFDVFLAFVPFLLAFFTSILLVYQLLLLFYFVTPIDEKRRGWVMATVNKIKKTPVQALFYPFIGLLPFIGFLLLTRLSLTFVPSPTFLNPLYITVRSFFLSLPVVLLGSVFVLGFFQFSFILEENRS